MSARRKWKPEWDKLLGTKLDTILAVELGISRKTVETHRTAAGLARCSKKQIGQCADCRRALERSQLRKLMLCARCKYNRQLERCRARHIDNKVAGLDRPSWAKTHPKERRLWAAGYRDRNRDEIRRYQRRWMKRHYRENKKLIKSLPCDSCGDKHTAQQRQAVIRRMLPCTTLDLHQAFECTWGPGGREYKGSAGSQRLWRDLQHIGAARRGTTYYLPQEALAA